MRVNSLYFAKTWSGVLYNFCDLKKFLVTLWENHLSQFDRQIPFLEVFAFTNKLQGKLQANAS